MVHDFWRTIQQLLSGRLVQSLSAQRDGEAILNEIVGALSRNLGYGPAIFPRQSKTFHRLAEKAKKLKSEHPDYTAEQTVKEIKDFAGARILVVTPEEVILVDNYICTSVEGRRDCRLAGEADRYLDNPKKGGWRGLKRILEIGRDGEDKFLFELQVMTYLQHTWDQ